MRLESTDPPPRGTCPHRQDLKPKRQKQPRMIHEGLTEGLVVVICRGGGGGGGGNGRGRLGQEQVSGRLVFTTENEFQDRNKDPGAYG